MSTGMDLTPRGTVDTLTVENLVTNPTPVVNTTGWSALGTGMGAGRISHEGVWSFGGTTTAALGASGGPWLWVECGRWDLTGIAAGTQLNLSIHRDASTALAWNMFAEFRDAAGANLSYVDPAGTAPNAPQRQSITVTVPANAAYVVIHLRAESATPSGTFWYARLAQITVGSTLYPYFDGASTDVTGTEYFWRGTAYASRSVRRDYITDPATFSTPVMILGYEATRDVRTSVHHVLGTSIPAVTQRPPGMRTGTLTYLFDDWTQASRAETIHTRSGTVYVSDPGLPGGGMRYVPQGQLTVRLNDETQAHWTVTTGFQEVP